MKLTGIGASAGSSIADIHYLQCADLSVTKRNGAVPSIEKQRIADATEQAKNELALLYTRASQTDPKVAAVFEVHQMMLDDPDFCESIEGILDIGLNAEWAVQETARIIREMFASIEDEYLRTRAADVTDVSNRLIRILKGIDDDNDILTSRVIVVAEDLLPSQTVKLDRNFVAGFVTKVGSSTSHSVILARTMGIPCVVGLGDSFDQIPRRGTIAIDGRTGEVYPDPDDNTKAEFEKRIASFHAETAALEKYRGKPAVTKSGRHTLVCANIGSPDDAAAALKNDADGVGLFRSEFLYLENEDFPDEQTQFEAYRSVLASLSPRPVVIRTLDLGSDKQAPYFQIGHEENPALGYRAIRICLERRDIFVTQLRALLRASVAGQLSIMFPMISHIEQVHEIKRIVAEVKQALFAEGLQYKDDVQFGVMVETPAAAWISDRLAKEVVFFSIGTNDLTQYTLAVDRTNASVHPLFDSAHPAVLRLIKITAQAAHEHGIWVGICGESASNTALTQFYMDIGIDELSVAPSSILSIKRAVSECE